MLTCVLREEHKSTSSFNSVQGLRTPTLLSFRNCQATKGGPILIRLLGKSNFVSSGENERRFFIILFSDHFVLRSFAIFLEASGFHARQKIDPKIPSLRVKGTSIQGVPKMLCFLQTGDSQGHLNFFIRLIGPRHLFLFPFIFIRI